MDDSSWHPNESLPRSWRWTLQGNLGGGGYRYNPSCALQYPERKPGSADHWFHPLGWHMQKTNLGNLPVRSLPRKLVGRDPASVQDITWQGGHFP